MDWKWWLSGDLDSNIADTKTSAEHSWNLLVVNTQNWPDASQLWIPATRAVTICGQQLHLAENIAYLCCISNVFTGIFINFYHPCRVKWTVMLYSNIKVLSVWSVDRPSWLPRRQSHKDILSLVRKCSPLCRVRVGIVLTVSVCLSVRLCHIRTKP